MLTSPRHPHLEVLVVAYFVAFWLMPYDRQFIISRLDQVEFINSNKPTTYVIIIGIRAVQ